MLVDSGSTVHPGPGRPVQETLKGAIKFIMRNPVGLDTGDHNNVQMIGNLVGPMPKILPQPPFDAVSGHRRSHLFADGNTKSGMIQTVVPKENQKQRGMIFLPPVGDLLELATFEQSGRFGEGKGSGIRGRIGDGILGRGCDHKITGRW